MTTENKTPVFECGNCGARHADEALKPVQDLEQRVLPGEPMPAGECPDCGALCHEVKETLTSYKVFAGTDTEGDSCLYINNVDTGIYLSEAQAEAIAEAIQDLLDAGTIAVPADEDEDDENEGDDL